MFHFFSKFGIVKHFEGKNAFAFDQFLYNITRYKNFPFLFM